MKLAFVGDVMLGRLVNDALKHVPPDYVWGDTLPLFHSADIRVCNLECVISDRGEPWAATEKAFHFRTDAKNIGVLKKANINAVSLANNHILDFEHEAMFDCLKILDQAKIARAGAGKNLEEASRPAMFEHSGMKIGLISITDNEPAWEATSNKPGIYYVPIDVKDHRSQQLLSLIQYTKPKTHFFIVAAHWGPNWGYEPPPEHIPFAHALIDAGADIIFGHSAHIFRGIEIYKNRPILYSTGDFIDDYAVDEIERNDQSFIFTLQADSRELKAESGKLRAVELYPTVIRDFQARRAQGAERDKIVEKMKKLCSGLGTKAIWNEKKRSLDIAVP